MSIKLGEKIDNIKDDINFPDDVDELDQMRDSLYEKMGYLAGKIDDRTQDLTEFYQSNIKQNRVSYIKEDDDVYEKAKNVDNMVNEFNNTRILIELIEKKIDKSNK